MLCSFGFDISHFSINCLNLMMYFSIADHFCCKLWKLWSLRNLDENERVSTVVATFIYSHNMILLFSHKMEVFFFNLMATNLTHQSVGTFLLQLSSIPFRTFSLLILVAFEGKSSLSLCLLDYHMR